jgi:hypothetical protein
MTPVEHPPPRPCDLLKCGEPGIGTATINVGQYTGRAEDELTLVLCKGHQGQVADGGIVGFAFVPVYAHEVQRPVVHLDP